MQAIFVILGYFVLAREVHNSRKRIESMLVLSTIIPLFVYAVSLIINGITAEGLVNFMIFYVISIITNTISNMIIYVIEELIPHHRW